MKVGDMVIIVAGRHEGKRGEMVDGRDVRHHPRYIYVRLGRDVVGVEGVDARLISPLELLAEVAE